MHITLANAFAEAAHEVLLAEVGLSLIRGETELLDSACETNDVTVLISLVGGVSGTVVYSLAEATALEMITRLMGEPFETFNNLAQSGIAELSNVITGRASTKLAQMGYDLQISPPTILLGAGAMLSTLDRPRLSLPLRGECGTVTLHLALRESEPHEHGTQPLKHAETSLPASAV